MQTIRASMDRGTRVARQLQTFAQLAPPRLQARELHQLMAGWMADFEEAVGPQMRLELRLRHSGSVLVDADQMQGALLNLLANAREASAPGALIVLELSRVARVAGMSCRIAVIDHGEGMSDDVAKQAVCEDQLNRWTGQRPDDHGGDPRQCQHHKPGIPPAVRPHDAPESQGAGKQHSLGAKLGYAARSARPPADSAPLCSLSPSAGCPAR